MDLAVPLPVPESEGEKIVVGAVVATVMFVGMGTGVAFADHDANDHSPWADAIGTGGAADAILGGVGVPPVGNAIDTTPGGFNGFGIGNAVAGITHNPNCPLHWAP